MLRYWIHQLWEMPLFCAKCGAITAHAILAREAFSKRFGISKDVPFVCRCNACGTFFVAFAGEMYLGGNESKDEYAKLLSQNRLLPGDWVYIDGRPRPNQISGLFVTKQEETVMLKSVGVQEKFSRPLLSRYNEQAPQGFKLLPAQIGSVLLGDPVYHVLRKATGFVVGRILDKSSEKVVVRLEGGKVLFITLPEKKQALPDDVLLKRLTAEMSRKFPGLSSEFRLNVVRNIAYVYGSVADLPTKENALAFVKSFSDFRGVVDMLSVKYAGTPISDADICRDAFRILEKEKSPLFYYDLHAENGELTLNAYYFAGSDLDGVTKELQNIAGIRRLKLELEKVEESPAALWRKANALEKLLKTQFIKFCLRVIPLSEGLLVEGHVKNHLQKKMLEFFANRITNKIKIVTRLRVSD